MKVIAYLANPDRFMRFSGPAIPIFGGLAGLLFAVGCIWSLGFSPAHELQGTSVKIMYVHVPAAYMAMATYAFMAMASFVSYIWRHSLADIAARAAAPMGCAFTFLALITGSIWGKATWGVWWDWDARMTSMLVLLFIYFGYIALWRAVENELEAARLAALLCLVGTINLPIIKFSVDFWETLHQPASLIRPDGPTMPSTMVLPLLVMLLAYTFLFAVYLCIRVRTVILEKRYQNRHVEKRQVSVAQPVQPVGIVGVSE